MKCKQSKEEIKYFKMANLKGYDDSVGGEFFGMMSDSEGVLFRNVPDIVLVHRRTSQILICDHKTGPLNGRTSKRTADIARRKKEDRGYWGYAMTDSWSNSFHQKDLIQKRIAEVSLGAHYVIIVKTITDEMKFKKAWIKKNPFVVLITEDELVSVLDEYQEVDTTIGSFHLRNYGAILPVYLKIINKSKTFKAITSKGIETFEGIVPVREETEECCLVVLE